MHKKRLILHIGAHKTGTTALQVLFSQHADQLRLAGVDYPHRESAKHVERSKCAGNLACLLDKMGYIEAGRARFDDDYSSTIDRLIADTDASNCKQVLFSGETFCKYSEPLVQYLAERTRHLEVSIVLFVRDPFDFALSIWKQQVKRFAETRDLQQYIPEVCQARTLEMFSGFERFNRHFNDLRLVNYDHCKGNIFTAFLQAAGIEPGQILANRERQKRLANASLTYSQARLVTGINSQYGQCSFSQTLIDYLIRHAPPRREDFYSESLHQVINTQYAELITAINQQLPAEQAIASGVRSRCSSPGDVHPDDLATLDDFLSRTKQLRPAGLLGKLGNHLRRRQWKKLPINFDPAGYLLLNPDLPADTDAMHHYCTYGQAEGRPYRIRIPSL